MNARDLQGLQVLLIECEERFAAPRVEGLRALGAFVVRVVDGRSALAHLRSHPVDAVLLAAPLPDADWTDLAAWIQQQPEAPALIVLAEEPHTVGSSRAGSPGRAPDAVLERTAKPAAVAEALAGAWSSRAEESGDGAADTNLPALLVALRECGESGVLEIRADGICTRIFFRGGAPAFAEGGALRETLGRMLLQRGALTETDYLRVIERMTERLMESETTRMGEVLVELGLLTPAEVFAALSEQVREKIIGCFRWHRFEHGFEPLDALPEELGVYPSLPLEPLLLAGLRAHFGPDRLEPLLAPFADSRPVLSEDLGMLTASFELSPVEQRLLRLLDGERTLAMARAAAPIDAVLAAQLLAALVLAQRVVWRDEDPRATRRCGATGESSLPASAGEPRRPVRSSLPPSAGEAPLPTEAVSSRPPRGTAPPSLARLRHTLERSAREGSFAIDPKSAVLEAERAFRQGLQLLERSAAAGALRAFGRACALRGDEPEYRMYEAWSALLAAPDAAARTLARAKAAACARRMLQRDRESPRAHGILAQISSAAGDLESAEMHFRAVLRVTPEDRDALRGLRMLERRRRGA